MLHREFATSSRCGITQKKKVTPAAPEATFLLWGIRTCRTISIFGLSISWSVVA